MNSKPQIKYVEQAKIEEYIELINFKRNHPFLREWSQWKDVVSKYFDKDTNDFSSSFLNNIYTSNPAHYRLITLVYRSLDCMGQPTVQDMESIYTSTQSGVYNYPVTGGFLSVRSKCKCDDVHDWSSNELISATTKFPYTGCKDQQQHILTFILSHILFRMRKSSRALRKYYASLIKVVLSLPLEKLEIFPVEFIYKPELYRTMRRSLLKEVYSRGYLDFTFDDLKEMPFKFEELKHIRQQGGTCQSLSATMFDRLCEMIRDNPTQQGLNLNHRLEIDDIYFKKLEQTVLSTQDVFLSAMKDTLMATAKEMMVMFIYVATVALLGYCITKFGLTVIFKALELIYRVICGDVFGSKESVVKEQSGGLSLPLLPALILNNVIAPPAHILSSIWSNPQTDRVMRRLGYLGDPKIHKGINQVIEWIKRIVFEVNKWYKESILGIAVAEDIESKSSPVISWYNDCDAFFKSYWDQTLQWNDANWSILMNLYGRGMAFTRQNVFNEFKQDIWKVIFKLGNLLEKFNTHGRAGASVRNPPVTLYLCGRTGVGKSSITYPLAAEILKGIFAKEGSPVDLKKYWKNLIYMRSAEQEYWDGYDGQLVTVFDDFGQLVDSSSSPNVELFEIIRASNSFPYPLHMASLEQKATTTFNSKIIMVSSNLPKPKVASLNFESALYRRFDLCVEVSRKPGVKPKPGQFDPDIYVFQRYDMCSQTIGGQMTYQEIVRWAAEAYFNRKGFVDSMDSYITKRLNEEDDCWADEVMEAIDKVNPKQQGLGSFIGATYNATRSVVSGTFNYTKQCYYEARETITGDFYHQTMTEIKVALEGLRFKLVRAQTLWEQFKSEHPYLVKAMKFVGLMAVVFGVLKLFSSFMNSTKKEKLMSPAQFIKGDKGVKNEAYNAPAVKPVKVEAYTQVKVAVPKVEGKVESGYNQREIKVAKVESEFLDIICECKLNEAFEKNPFKTYFTKENLCGECNKSVKRSYVQEEGVKDINASEMLMKIIKTNLYKIYCNKTQEAIGHAMFLRGRIVMCPKHYTAAFKRVAKMENTTVSFQNVFLSRAFEIDVNDILDNAFYLDSPDEEEQPVYSRDIMSFPVRTATFHSNIEPYFATKESLSFVRSTEVVLPILLNNDISKSDRATVLFRYTEGNAKLSVRPTTQVEDEQGQVTRVMRDLWSYSMDTQPSECGAPLIVRNVNINPGKIIGMHVAGLEGSGLGFSTPIYKKDVSTILSAFSAHDTVEFRKELKLNEYPTQQCQVPEEAEFIRMGSISQGIAQPTKTKIEPSLIHGKIQEPKTKPCCLSSWKIDGEKFSPRSYRLGRLGNIPTYLPQKKIDSAKLALIDDISKKISDMDFGPNIKPVYTFDEAVVGIDGEEYINSIKRNTSPGYPFVHLKGFENRKMIFGDDDKCDTSLPTCQILKRRCERIVELAKQGIVTEHVFMDTIKDERKPIHKAHKSRLFSAGPLDYLIVCKQYFNGIVAVLQKARNFSHISVGTNPHSFDWSNIARELLSKSCNIVAGDFEGFDASQYVQMLQAAGEVLIELSRRFCGSTQEDCFVMHVLLIALFNSVHVSGKEVYQWTHSLPSGHYLTAVINSIFVCLSFATVYQISENKQNYITARTFYERCGLVAYGDDHLLSLPVDILENFNQITLPALFKQIGLGYTMEDKDATATEKARPIGEVSYLKRSFRFDRDRHMWLGPITMDTVLESPMWVHKCPDKRAQTCEQIDNSLRELAMHPEEIWNKWYPVFEKCGKQLGHYTQYAIYSETQDAVLN